MEFFCKSVIVCYFFRGNCDSLLTIYVIQDMSGVCGGEYLF